MVICARCAGHAWVSDYGSPDKADDFAVLYKYSPLHNVQRPGAGSGQYPAVILTTGVRDTSTAHNGQQHTLQLVQLCCGP